MQAWKGEDPPHLGGSSLDHTHVDASVFRYPLSNTNSLVDFKGLLDQPWTFQTPPTQVFTLSENALLVSPFFTKMPSHLPGHTTKLSFPTLRIYSLSPSFSLGDSSPYGMLSILSFI